jgi:uncharacterized phage protein gp47/JayE
MATTFPLAKLSATVTADGITAPPYADIYQSLQATFQGIYGTDAYIDPDSQDGQLLAAFAKAISDSNDTAIAVYNSFSPATSQGAALSNNVKLNGVARAVPTKGSVLQRVVGQVGAEITDGVVGDGLNTWLLPTPLVRPPAGQIDVTATAAKDGAITALIGTITTMVNPQLGWQSTTNLAEATPGAPVETDAALRRRQTVSTALPSRTVLDGIVGGIAGIDGVTQVRGYENDTDTTDANGLLPHSTALVVLGGDALDIATLYLNKKTPGANTNGTTVQAVISSSGIPYNIRFYIPTRPRITMAVTVKGLSGYTSAITAQIKQALADYVNALGIGKRIDWGRLFLPAQLYGAPASLTFEVNVLTLAKFPAANTAADVEIAFNEMASLVVADIVLTVTS